MIGPKGYGTPSAWENGPVHPRWGASAFGYYRRKPRPDPTLTYGDGPACPLPTYTENRDAWRDARAMADRDRPKRTAKVAKVKADMRPQHAKGLPCMCATCRLTVRRATGTVEHAVKDHL